MDRPVGVGQRAGHQNVSLVWQGWSQLGDVAVGGNYATVTTLSTGVAVAGLGDIFNLLELGLVCGVAVSLEARNGAFLHEGLQSRVHRAHPSSTTRLNDRF
jgi:hypothetical protein